MGRLCVVRIVTKVAGPEQRRLFFVVDYTKEYVKLHNVKYRSGKDTEALVAK